MTDQETQPAERRASTLGAEALSIAAVVLSAASLWGTRLVNTLAAVSAGTGGQIAAVTRVVVGDGATGLVGVVLALVAMITANTGTRPWARWLAAAALILGAISVIVSVVTFFVLPEPQPQPPVPGLR